MSEPLQYEVHPKEKFYFAVKVAACVALYPTLVLWVVGMFTVGLYKPAMLGVGLLYVGLIVFFLLMQMGLLVGYLRGNAIKVTAHQFPDINKIVESQSHALGLAKVPDVYIMQSGGVLNAFATRFWGINYVVLYSDVVESAYEQDENVLAFIIGHELGHIKRNHLLKRLVLFPSVIVPFLGSAYSRGCEYTCDSIGHSLCPEGSRNGLMLLVAGRGLFKKVDRWEYIEQGKREASFWQWFAEKVSTHPHITKRIAVLPAEVKKSFKAKVELVREQPLDSVPTTTSSVSDHSKYLPG